jgi:methylmalonyl-CoA mutase
MCIEEDVQGIAVTSYQGGHVEFFKYMKDLLNENGCGHIKIFGGGGGTILPSEIDELHHYGITRIYSPDDGRKMGLEGMIKDVINQCSFTLNGNGIFTKAMTLGEVKDVRTDCPADHQCRKWRAQYRVASKREERHKSRTWHYGYWWCR